MAVVHLGLHKLGRLGLNELVHYNVPKNSTNYHESDQTGLWCIKQLPPCRKSMLTQAVCGNVNR
jgi:hypothetical protein